MEKKIVNLFIFDGFSDWEPAYAAAEINQSEGYRIVTVAPTRETVQSAGGLTVLPDRGLDDIDIKEASMIILPGGRAWEERKLREITPVIREYHSHRVPVAAICGATTFLADMGLLDHIRHTSNGKDYLIQHSARYDGAARYQEKPVVYDDHILTANGTAAVEFAREIFLILGIYDAGLADQWFRLFKNGITQ